MCEQKKYYNDYWGHPLIHRCSADVVIFVETESVIDQRNNRLRERIRCSANVVNHCTQIEIDRSLHELKSNPNHCGRYKIVLWECRVLHLSYQSRCPITRVSPVNMVQGSLSLFPTIWFVHHSCQISGLSAIYKSTRQNFTPYLNSPNSLLSCSSATRYWWPSHFQLSIKIPPLWK